MTPLTENSRHNRLPAAGGSCRLAWSPTGPWPVTYAADPMHGPLTPSQPLAWKPALSARVSPTARGRACRARTLARRAVPELGALHTRSVASRGTALPHRAPQHQPPPPRLGAAASPGGPSRSSAGPLGGRGSEEGVHTKEGGPGARVGWDVETVP